MTRVALSAVLGITSFTWLAPPPAVAQELDDEVDLESEELDAEAEYEPGEFESTFVQAYEQMDGPPAAFAEPLEQYGEWFYMNTVGWVWRPSASVVGSEFRPYATGGQWVTTPDGWIFESSYPFGWATFHYGRWLLDSNFGWIWVPGDIWGPSWVRWRVGGGYVGWAPLPPAGFSISVGFSPWWFFVPVGYFFTKSHNF